MYDVDFDPDATAQLTYLPEEIAWKALQELGLAAADPWNYQRRPDEPLDVHNAHRWIYFDNYSGRVSFLIQGGLGVLLVTGVEWLG